jgi:hypothetical protein
MATGSIALGALMTGAGLFSLLLAALFLRGLRNLASETFPATLNGAPLAARCRHDHHR